MIKAAVIADSIGNRLPRLTTFELTYPKFIHSELMTHRQLNRCASSSRAIPIEKMMRAIRDTPACPVHWGANQKGMQAAVELRGWRQTLAKRLFLAARWPALFFVWVLSKIGLHKQVANRILEPWAHITVVVTATEWDNFFALRTDINAQPEFQRLALQMLEAMNSSVPKLLRPGQWHLPYVGDGCSSPGDATCWNDNGFPCVSDDVKQSVARCARTSYVGVDGRTYSTTKEDAGLFDKLLSKAPLHASPAEHQAAVPGPPLKLPRLGGWSGNLQGGWVQFRKMIGGESVDEFRRLRHWGAYKNKLTPSFMDPCGKPAPTPDFLPCTRESIHQGPCAHPFAGGPQ